MNFRQLDFGWRTPRVNVGPGADAVEVDGRKFKVLYQRNPLAKRYRLYVDRHGQPRVTIPRRGSRHEAHRFFEQHSGWLEERLRRFAIQPGRHTRWLDGTEIFFRGTLTRIELIDGDTGTSIRLGPELFPIPLLENGAEDLRRFVEAHLRRLASSDLPPRVLELASRHSSPVQRVTVRNQATRWGSCSRRGTVSLNWRLVQVPLDVRDYIILHELMHLREMNHSPRFWAHVAAVCPGFEACETWLRKHSAIIL